VLANHGALSTISTDPTDATDGFVGLAPAGSFPDGATPQGLLDMAGNAAEWVVDELELDSTGRHPVPYPDTPEVDPPPRQIGGLPHGLRGGSYEDSPVWLRGAARSTTDLTRSPSIGFRCVASVR
jgi:formylglycine-generating enzyme required for sulfatase activity